MSRKLVDCLHAPSPSQNSMYHDLCYTNCGALTGMRNSSKSPLYPIGEALLLMTLIFLLMFCLQLEEMNTNLGKSSRVLSGMMKRYA